VELNNVGENEAEFLTNNNLYKYGIGEGNTSQKLYEIRYVNTSQTTKTVLELNKTLDKKSPNKLDKSLSLLSSIIGMVGLISANTYQFLYPGLIEYLQSNTDITTRLNIPKIKGATVDERNIEITTLEEIRKRPKINLDVLNESKAKLKKTDVAIEQQESLYKQLWERLSKPSFVFSETGDEEEQEPAATDKLSPEEEAELAVIPISIPQGVIPTSNEELRNVEFISNKKYMEYR
jgi:hypothetical protein